MHMASAIAFRSSGLPQVEWLDDHYQKASINGKAISFGEIKGFVFERMEAAKTLLEREILFRHDFNEFGYNCSKVVDILRQRKVRYSFIDSLENGFVKFRAKVLEVLLKDPLVRPIFVKRVNGQELEG